MSGPDDRRVAPEHAFDDGKILRMGNAEEASAAARTLSRARWGSTRTDRLVTELARRADEITPESAATLRELVAERQREDA